MDDVSLSGELPEIKPAIPLWVNCLGLFMILDM